MTGPAATGGGGGSGPASSREASRVGWPGAAPPQQPPQPSVPPRTSPPASAPPSTGPAVSVGLSQRRARRATLVIRRVDPWSMLKISFMYSSALVLVFLVAAIALYALLTGMGVFDSVDDVLRQIDTDFRLGQPLSKVILVTVVIGLVDIVLLTALATLGAFVYNLVADMVGGVEVTLSERE